ncbi:hypothetical protein T492DRAFT_1120586 [Pavlovales sp. CCMP2436]|nr:hypothetical protein T492DRAFT_1120586 [Pavlovales sp. CCMP2436]
MHWIVLMSPLTLSYFIRSEQAGVWELRATVNGIEIIGVAPTRVLVEPGLAYAHSTALIWNTFPLFFLAAVAPARDLVKPGLSYAHSTGVEEGTRLAGSALLAKECVAFLLLVKDRFGNPTMRGGDELAAICSRSAEPVLMHDWNDGRYEIQFCPRALGSHSIRFSMNGGGDVIGDVIGSPFSFLVQPGSASAEHSSAHGPALDGGVLSDGIGNFLIVTRDALGYRY